jgi:ankyrin repeat protein
MSTTEFFDAIRAGDAGKVRALLDVDPEIASARDPNGVSAVLTSIYTGRGEIRDLLLQRGAVLEIHDAAAAGKLNEVKEFVEKNPALAKSYSPDGFPVVALACFFGHLDVARYLAAQGADLNAAASNGSGYNSLTASVAAGHTQIVAWLLENGVSANYRYGPGYTPLLTAAANGRLDIVKLLLAHGADPTARTDDGRSAADLAAERKHPELVAYFNRERSPSGLSS